MNLHSNAPGRLNAGYRRKLPAIDINEMSLDVDDIIGAAVFIGLMLICLGFV